MGDELHRPIRAGPSPIHHVLAFNVHRDPAHQLVADSYNPNGLIRATLIEQERRVQVQTYRNSIWRFIDNIHATTFNSGQPGTALRIWGYYVEFSIWSLIGMTLSGIWLGLVTRWRFRWTIIAFAVGCGAFAIFYLIER